jgi:hypothetical protein
MVRHTEEAIMGNKIQDRLAEMDASYKENRNKAPGVPDDLYTMRLQSAELVMTEKGMLRIKLEHLVCDGAYAGEVLKDGINCEGHENSWYYVSQWIRKMGYEPPASTKQLEEVIAAIVEESPCYTAKVVTNGDFKNVRIQRLVDAPRTTTAAKSKSKATAKSKKDEEEEAPAPVAPASTAKRKKKEVEPEESKGVSDADLAEFMSAQGMEEYQDGMESSDMINAINEYEWEEKDLTPDELALLNSIGATVLKKVGKK